MDKTTSWSDIANLFRSADPKTLHAYVSSLPESPPRDLALRLLPHVTSQPAWRSIALSCLASGPVYGQDPILGAMLARAAYVLLSEAISTFGDQVIYPPSVGEAAYQSFHGLTLAGRFQEALDFASEIPPVYRTLSLEAGVVSALAELNRLGAAAAGLDRIVTQSPSTIPSLTPADLNRPDVVDSLIRAIDEGKEGVPASIEIGRLSQLLQQLLKPATELASSMPPTPSSYEAARQAELDLESQKAVFDRLGWVVNGPMNRWKADLIYQEAGALLIHPENGTRPDFLAPCLQRLLEVRAWAIANQAVSREREVLWPIAVIQRRLGDLDAAVASLQALRANQEMARASIEEPLERAGIASEFRWLFPSLCQMLTILDRPAALLEAIEGSKGRVIQEVLERRMGAPNPPAVGTSQVESPLPSLMAELGIHYVTYFVDESETYAVLVARDGSVHSSGSIPLGKSEARNVVSAVDPRTWRVDLRTPMKPPAKPVAETLQPLLSWLAPFWESGLLRRGDHICYCPDEHLFHVPLHYVLFQGDPLAERFSVSRVQSALMLEALMTPGTGHPPERAVGIEVPMSMDEVRPGFLENLHRAVDWLTTRLPGSAVRGAEGTAESLLNLGTSQAVVHFATHGQFPNQEAMVLNPFVGSGLLLADDTGLPKETAVAAHSWGGLLSPQRVLEMGLDFRSSHVSLQACVSGLAAEGIGGDALGLEWAFLQAGARSVIDTHWNVPPDVAADFFISFYRRWLQEGVSRRLAWWMTVNELRQANPDPYAWAAYSLAGDWR